MYYLFNNTYLDFDFRYTSQFDHWVVSKNFVQDPLTKNLLGDTPLERNTIFDEFFEIHFKSDYNKLWKSLFEKNKKFIFYLDIIHYQKLLIQFFKSIFVNADIEKTYWLYQIHIDELVMKSQLQKSDLRNELPLYNHSELNLSYDEFCAIYNNVEKVQFLREMNKAHLGYEFHLANFFLDESLDETLISKIKFYGWKLVINEIEGMKEEVIKGAFDLLNIFKKNTEESVHNHIGNINQLLRINPKLMWVYDSNLNIDNIDYILSTYNIDNFVECFQLNMQRVYVDKFDIQKDKTFKLFKLIFEQKYIEALKMDIEMGFGSNFISSQDFFNINSLLVSYIYDRVRLNKREELAFMKV